MPKSLLHYFNDKFNYEDYSKNQKKYKNDFISHFASKYHQNRNEVEKKLGLILNQSDELLVKKRTRDEVGCFSKRTKTEDDIAIEVDLNCKRLQFVTNDCNLITASVNEIFMRDGPDVQQWSLADGNNGLLLSNAKFICLLKTGEWKIKVSAEFVRAIEKLVKKISKALYNCLPTNHKKTFRTVFRSGKPTDVFINRYPAQCDSSGAAHADNVSFASSVTQLTCNDDAGLFYLPGAEYSDIPLELKKGETICLFKGVEHKVSWSNKITDRLSLVCRF